MPAEARPRRSALLLPGAREDALETARTLPADAVIVDLADATTPTEKLAARALARRHGAAGAFGAREVIIRINGLDTAWGAADLVAASEVGPDAILVPHVESAEQIAEVDSRMRYHDAPVDTAIWAMIETPLGVLRAQDIATAPRMAGFVMGTDGLAGRLRAEHGPDRQPMITALGLALLAARAYGLACIDGAHDAPNDAPDDADRLRAACTQARAMGFDGKILIDPAQIAAANEIFGPDPAAIERARQTVAAFDAAATRGEDVAMLDGRIVQRTQFEQAKRLLDEADAIASLETAA